MTKVKAPRFSSTIVVELYIWSLLLSVTIDQAFSACNTTSNSASTVAVRTMHSLKLRTNEAYWLAGLSYSQIEGHGPAFHSYLPFWDIKVEASPKPQVLAQLAQVTADGKPTRVTHQRVVNDGIFDFSFSGTLQANNSGSYRLVVVTPEPSFKLHVVVPPQVTLLNVNDAFVGQGQISHQCCANGYPPPNVTWLVNGTTCPGCVESQHVSLVSTGLWSVCKNLTIPSQLLSEGSVWNLSCTARANFSSSKCSPPSAPQKKCKLIARSASMKSSLMRVLRQAAVKSTSQRYIPTSSASDTLSPTQPTMQGSPRDTLSTAQPTMQGSPSYARSTAQPTMQSLTSYVKSEPLPLTTALPITITMHTPSRASSAKTSSAASKSAEKDETPLSLYILPAVGGFLSFMLGLAAAYFLEHRKSDNGSATTVLERKLPVAPTLDGERVYAEPEFVNLHKIANLPTAAELTKSAVSGNTRPSQAYENSPLPAVTGKVDESLADYMILVD